MPNYQLRESLFNRWKRRFISITILLAATCFWLILAPLWIICAVLFDCLSKKTSALRGAIFITWFFLCEIYGVIFAGWLFIRFMIDRNADAFLLRNFRLQSSWASHLWEGAQKCFRFKIDIDDQANTSKGPVLLFLRHSSMADTLIPSITISKPYDIRYRYVIKRELLWDPCLDIVGQRLPNVFVRRQSPDSQAEIESTQSLMNNLAKNEGVLIYPEGTRFTPNKRQRLIEKFHHTGNSTARANAEQLKNLLLPRMGGANALMQSNQHLDIVICAHTGFDKVTSLNQLWNGGLLDTQVKVRFQRFALNTVPADDKARSQWLLERWFEIDNWLEAQAERINQ